MTDNISLTGPIYNDTNNNISLSSDISCNNITVANDINLYTLTTNKCKILNDGTLQIYFSGNPLLPLKAGNTWWSVVDELEEVQLLLFQLDGTITGITTDIAQVNLALTTIGATAASALTSANNAFTLATANSTAIAGLVGTLIGINTNNPMVEVIRSNFTASYPLYFETDSSLNLILKYDSDDFELDISNNLKIKSSLMNTINNTLMNIEQLNDNIVLLDTSLNNNFYTKTNIDNFLLNYYTKTYIDNLIANYYNSTYINNNFYTKSYSNITFETKTNVLYYFNSLNNNVYKKNETYTQSEINSLITNLNISTINDSILNN